MIMMRVSCTVLTFCLSRLKLRPGLLSPFAHALTQTVCKVYHAYYILYITCIMYPQTFLFSIMSPWSLNWVPLLAQHPTPSL